VEFEAIDTSLAKLMERLNGVSDPLLFSAVEQASRALRSGHTCLELTGFLNASDCERLAACPVFACDNSPLVLSGGRLYLRRFYAAEQDLARRIRALASGSSSMAEALPAARLEAFSVGGADPVQIAAVALALKQNFSVITGGPGTGKTTTVAMILSLLLEREPATRIALAAPTGKAADRLRTAVTQAAARLDLTNEVAARLPQTAATLHRLLGYGPRGFGAVKPLNYDVIVVDEASMVSLPLMARLVASVRPGSRLILLGDKDQLASVEAGYVLGDIFEAACAGAPGLKDCVIELKRTWRFDAASSIGELSRAVNAGDAPAVDAALALSAADLQLSCDLPTDFDERLQAWYSATLAAGDWPERFARLASFRVLCAFNQGPRGTARFNERIEQSLKLKGLIRPGSGPHYHGRPVMITRNDYSLGLYNGDIGLIMTDAAGDLAAWFPSPDGARRLSLARLPEHETVFAMTVHKSQGSEFDEVTLVLPEADSPLLTRELVYTGLTRARRRLEIIGSPDILKLAAARRIRRASGLVEALVLV